MVSEEYKDRINKVTRFIESCWDCNNPDDGLTFDERIRVKMGNLNSDDRKIVNDALEWEVQ